MADKNEYRFTFHGEPVGTERTVHDVLHVVLTYPRPTDFRGLQVGAPAFTPKVAARFLTARSALKRITDDPTHLATYVGQSFVIKAFPGTTEITDAEVITHV